MRDVPIRLLFSEWEARPISDAHQVPLVLKEAAHPLLDRVSRSSTHGVMNNDQGLLLLQPDELSAKLGCNWVFTD